VDVYQSEFFRDVITAPTHELAAHGYGRIVYTPDAGGLGASLDAMRDRMLDQPLLGSVFVGGMEGIIAEYERVGDRPEPIARLPLNAPGGCAARLEPTGPSGRPLPHDLISQLGSPRYPLVAASIVSYLASIDR
jgi:hypothetical protein